MITDNALTEKKLALDRALALWKRRTDLAEEILTDFYLAKDILDDVRSPGSLGGEGHTRPREPWETEQDTTCSIHTIVRSNGWRREMYSSLD